MSRCRRLKKRWRNRRRGEGKGWERELGFESLREVGYRGGAEEKEKGPEKKNERR